MVKANIACIICKAKLNKMIGERVIGIKFKYFRKSNLTTIFSLLINVDSKSILAKSNRYIGILYGIMISEHLSRAVKKIIYKTIIYLNQHNYTVVKRGHSQKRTK